MWAGKVVDFIDVGPWPIFNLADSSIVVGIFILMTTFMFTKDSDAEQSEGPKVDPVHAVDGSPPILPSTQDE